MARQATTSTDFVNFGDITILDGLTQLTVCCWVYVDSWSLSNSYADTWRKDGAISMQRDAGNNNFCTNVWWSSLTTVAHSGYTYTEGAWHFSAVVIDRTLSSSRLKLFAAGLADASMTSVGTHDLNGTSSIQNSANSLVLFNASSGGAEHFRGRLSGLAFFDFPMTTDQLLAYRYSPALINHGRIFYCPLWGDSPETEYSGSKLNGTLTGTTLVADPPTGAPFDMGQMWLPTSGEPWTGPAITTGQDGSLVLGLAAAEGPTANDPATGWLEAQDYSPGSGVYGALVYKVASTAGIYTPAGTFTGASILGNRATVALKATDVQPAGRVNARASSAIALNFGVASTGSVAGAVTASASVALALDVSSAGRLGSVGAAAIPLTLTLGSAGIVAARGAAAIPLALTLASNGTRITLGSAEIPLALTLASTGRLGISGSAAVPLIFDVASQGTRITLGSGSALISFSLNFVSAGRVGVRGSAAIPLALALASAGRLGVTASAAIPLTLTYSSNGTRIALGTGSAPLIFDASTRGTRAALGSAAIPLALAIAAAGRLNATGSAAIPLVFSVTQSAGRVGRRGSSAIPLSFLVSSSGGRVATGTAAVPLSFTVASVGRTRYRGSAAIPLSISVSSGGRVGIRGSAAIPLLFSVSSTGYKLAVGAGTASLGLTFGVTSSGVRVATGSSAIPLSFLVGSSSTRTTFGVSELPLTFSVSSGGVRDGKGSSAVALTFSFASNGIAFFMGALSEASGAAISETVLFECLVSDWRPYEIDLSESAMADVAVSDKMGG